MCPNCLTNIAMGPLALLGASLGGAGSAVLLATAALRFGTARPTKLAQSDTEETIP
jgi:hypothetical protein